MSYTTNFQLYELGKKLNISIKGIYNKDYFHLLDDPKSGECFIVNLADSDEPGTHWTAIYFYGNYAYYFDSYGFREPVEISKFIKRYTAKLLSSDKQIQSVRSGYCGWYCIAFLYHMINSKLPKIQAFKQFLSMYDDYDKK